MKFQKLKPGMTVYDVHKYTMGNTTMRSVGVWAVSIVSVAEDGRSVLASWNGNAPSRFEIRIAEKWREKRPLLIRTTIGGYRLATREEQKAARNG